MSDERRRSNGARNAGVPRPWAMWSSGSCGRKGSLSFDHAGAGLHHASDHAARLWVADSGELARV